MIREGVGKKIIYCPKNREEVNTRSKNWKKPLLMSCCVENYDSLQLRFLLLLA
jgi:hypothetical protein